MVLSVICCLHEEHLQQALSNRVRWRSDSPLWMADQQTSTATEQSRGWCTADRLPCSLSRVVYLILSVLIRIRKSIWTGQKLLIACYQYIHIKISKNICNSPSSVRLIFQLWFVLATQFSLQGDFKVFNPTSPNLPQSKRRSLSTSQGAPLIHC